MQGESVSRKHVEVIIRQMFSRVKIKDNGDTCFGIGDIIELSYFLEENSKIHAKGGKEGKADSIILGISNVALTTKSFLSSASFQNTTRVLIQSALRGARDELRGLKENVIVGRLIPVGTGFKKKITEN